MLGRDEIIQEAMSLPPEDRAYVADQIEQSLGQDGFTSAETAAAWATEIERRVAAYDRGELQASGAESALARMRARVAEHRAGKVNT